MMKSKSQQTHVLGKSDQRVLCTVQIEMVTLARVVADEADLLICRRRIAVKHRPPTSRG